MATPSKKTRIKTRVELLSLSALPAVLLCIALSSLFLNLHSTEKSKNLEDAIKLIDIVFLSEGAYSHSEKTPELFSKKARQLLTFSAFRSIALLDGQNIVVNIGLPLSQISIRNNPKETRGLVVTNKQGLRTALYADIERNLAGLEHEDLRLIIEMDSTSAALVNTKFITYLSLAFLLCTIMAYFYFNRMQELVFRPLDSITKKLEIGIYKKDKQELVLDNIGIYLELLTLINQLIHSAANNQNEFNKSIDQATSELREALESREIQNIELDIERKEAINISKSKSDFLAKTSHEIRTPLNGILGFTDLLKNTPLRADQRDFLSTIEDSAKGLLTVINDIVDLSHLESGNLNLEHKPLNVFEVVENALILQAANANERGIKLICIPNDDLPQALLGDPLRVQQILSNVIASAMRFNAASYACISIDEVERSDNLAELRFSVSTDGKSNIDSDSSFFERDFTTKELSVGEFSSGAGMGLNIAKALVKRMRGQIGLECENNELTHVFFHIVFGRETKKNNSEHTFLPLNNVHAVLYDSSTAGLNELSKRILTWGGETLSTQNFSDLLEKAKKVKSLARKYTRYYPIVLIEAQTSQGFIDKETLKETVEQLVNGIDIPTVLIAPPGKYQTVDDCVSGLKVPIIQRPFICKKLLSCLFDELGLMPANTDSSRVITLNQNNEPPIEVLVADDNPANMKLVIELLKDFNTVVTPASNGLEALSAFKTKTFDVVFMDIQMPTMNGYEATKKIRLFEIESNATKRTPVVALTAHAVIEEKSKLLLAGMDDYLCKPIDTKDLSHLLNRWVIKETEVNVNPKRSKITTEVGGNFQTTSLPVNISRSIELAKNKTDLAKDMLKMLIDTLPNERKQILASYEANDLHELQHVVHRIHGGCCYTDVPKLLRASKTLDKNLLSGEKLELKKEVNTLIESVDELIAWNKEHDIDALFGE